MKRENLAEIDVIESKRFSRIFNGAGRREKKDLKMS
jgi:hypothetical protein